MLLVCGDEDDVAAWLVIVGLLGGSRGVVPVLLYSYEGSSLLMIDFLFRESLLFCTWLRWAHNLLLLL